MFCPNYDRWHIPTKCFCNVAMAPSVAGPINTSAESSLSDMATISFLVRIS